MSRQKAKKKPILQLSIRTDVWDLVASLEQKHQMMLTVSEYRRFLRPLVLIVNAQWINLVDLRSKERINTVEKMIHQTADNPSPKQEYFQKVVNKYPSFRKFPSYLRRAAIADAIGIVSSFNTRYQEWQSGIRKHKTVRPPRLTAMCNTYPALYKGQQIRYGENYQTIDLKVWSGTDWIWINNIGVKGYGLNRHQIQGNEMQSPALVVNKKTCQLSMPVQVKALKREDSEFVCSVDMGINNVAVASIVGRDGTVKARKFINPARDIDRRDRRRMMIKRKSRQTTNVTRQKLGRGFCKGLYRKSSNINLEIARGCVRGIIEFAKTHNVKVIVSLEFVWLEGKSWKKRLPAKTKISSLVSLQNS